MDGGKSVPKRGSGRLCEVIKMQRENGTSDFSVFTTEQPPYLTAGHRLTPIITGLSNMMSRLCTRRRKKREKKKNRESFNYYYSRLNLPLSITKGSPDR